MTPTAWRRLGNSAQLAMLIVLPFAAGWVWIDRPVAGVLPAYSSFVLYASDVFVLAAVGLWLAGHVRRPARPLHIGPWFVWGPLAVLIGWTALSVTWSMAPSVTAELGVRLVVLGAVYLMMADDGVAVGLLAGALAVGMVLESVPAVLQFGRQRDLGLGWLGEPAAVIHTAGLWVRGTGLTRHPNILGGYLVMGLAATLGLTAARTAGRWTWPVLALGTAGLVATFSRSAWLGLFAGMTIAGVALWTADATERRAGARALRRLALVLATVGFAAVAGYPTHFASRIWTPIASVVRWTDVPADHVELVNLAERAHFRTVAGALRADRPAVGVGGGAFAVASRLADPDQPAGHAYLPVHDVWRLLASELGPLGGAAWAWLVLGIVAAVIRHRRRLAREPWLMAWSLALIALFTTSLVDSYLWSWQSGRLLLFVQLGLWARAYRQSDSAAMQ